MHSSRDSARTVSLRSGAIPDDGARIARSIGPVQGRRSVSSSKSRAVRLRMADTGEKYTQALRYLESNPDEYRRLKSILEFSDRRRRYPDTNRDGLDRRHLLSAFETSRRKH